MNTYKKKKSTEEMITPGADLEQQIIKLIYQDEHYIPSRAVVLKLIDTLNENLQLLANQTEEMLELKLNIKSAFHNWIAEDPFPELTQWDSNETMRTSLDKFFRVHANPGPRPEISAHKAWTQGFNFAKDLVFKVLK